MPSKRPRSSWDLRASMLLFPLAVIEVVWANQPLAPRSGANIGLPIAIIAAVAASVAVIGTALARVNSKEVRAKVIARGIGVLALFIAGPLVLLLGLGMLEEL
jgi:hypothetical protein